MTHFLHRHPLVRDALVWAVPALIFGAVLRLMLLSYSPLAYWGSDSRSYFGFAHGVLSDFSISLSEKRRFIYPLFLLPVSVLPGSPLRWLAWIQAVLGLATIVPLAYAARKTFFAWKLWIVPVTVLYAGMPLLIWYEHEMLAETIFFDAIVWSCAGWAAWVMATDPARARRLWWCFFVPFAIVMLTKPSARFFLPGIVLGIVLTGAWRTLGWREAAAAVGVFLLTFTMGDDEQGSWLLYVSAFPLTQTDTPLHAEYKAEIRDRIEEARRNIDTYGGDDGGAFLFLRNPRKQNAGPLWRELARDEEKLAAIYHDLAIEAIKAHPFLFCYISLQRLVGSANMSEFKEDRFEATHFADRFRDSYDGNRSSESMVRMVFGLAKEGPLPPFEHFEKRVLPQPHSRAAEWLRNYAAAYGRHGRLVGGDFEDSNILAARPTVLSLWLLACGGLAMLGPYRRTMGVWTVTIGLYLFAVFLVGVQNHRYFAAAWPILILLLPVGLDALFRPGRHLRPVPAPGSAG